MPDHRKITLHKQQNATFTNRRPVQVEHLDLMGMPGDLLEANPRVLAATGFPRGHGQIDVAVKTAKKDELPEGMLFIAYGDLSSRLMGGDTHGSGMPTSKGLDVELTVLK